VSIPQAVDFVNAHAIASYSTNVAEFGLGAGYFRHHFQAQYEGKCDQSGYVKVAADSATSGGYYTPPVYGCQQSGPSVVQHLRLGAMDGINVRLTNTLAINSGQFRFGYFEGSLDFPISRDLNLYGAGGGSTGTGWGEVGIRTFFGGVGGRDTFILTTGIGGSSIRTKELFKQEEGSGGNVYTDTHDAVGGLHITVGLEYRL
jgi:hypothetical protein